MSVSHHTSHRFLTGLLAGASLLALSSSAWADITASTTPTGGAVTAGNATISQQGSTVTVNQTSQRAILGWQTFDVGSGAAVNFVQPNNAAVALNRVLSGVPSTINGSIKANGQVFLINPAGIVFGAGAVVNVGGLVASTMTITDSDFMAGKNNFQRNGSIGRIVNQGSITATPGGMIALLAPELRNEGVITAQLGSIVMAAGEQVVLNIDTKGGVTVQVDPATIKTMIDNRSMVMAQNGAVILSAKAADALIGSVINNSGVIEASSLTTKGGSIELSGATSITNSGTLDASGITGGKILIAADQSAGLADIAGKVSVAGSKGKGGSATITGNQVLVDQGAHIDATGTSGGGAINVGGSWQGQDPTIPESTGTVVAPTAILDASATINGNGGSIVVRSDVTNVNSVTRAYGTFLAQGATQGGNGGRIETSGYWLDTAGSTGSAAARQGGTAGLWLFDPYDVTISNSGSSGSFSGGSPATWAASGSGSTVNTADITTYLNGGTNVLISTTGAGGANGDITVSSAIQKTAGNGDVTLTLSANNNVVVNAGISNSGGSGKLNVNLDADSDANGAGIVYLNGDISTGGGNVAFGLGTTTSINGVSTMVGGDVYVTGAGARSITTGGGSVAVNGQIILADTSGFNITTGGGNVSFAGLIDSGDSYTLVSAPATTWTTDIAAAQSGTGGNVGDTYLATVTSRLESQVVATTSYSGGSYQAVWLGARRVTGIGSDAVWRWVAGPEGLTNGGAGLPFFTQSPLGGGTPINGAYNNWNGGGTIASSEPNNAGGGTNLGVESESVLQTLGASGFWNDLSKTTSTLNYYMMETNLANSPLTVNAGSGIVTFSGAVGTNKQLSALTVTGGTIAVNGGSIATTSSQTYTGPVTLGASSSAFTVSAGNFVTVANQSFTNATGSAATMSVTASGDVELSSNGSISSSTGSLGVTLTSQGGTVKLDSGSSINSNGGAIKIASNALSVNATATAQGGGSGSLQIMPYTAGTTMGLGSGASGSLNLANALFSSNFINNSFGSVILGGNNTGLVTVGNTLMLANHSTIESNANIAFAANANVTANGFLGLQLDNGGTATENNASVINASALSLAGTGATYTLNNGLNTASTFTATTGTVNYVNQSSLAVGVTGVTNGVAATGDVTVQTIAATADLTLNKAVTSSGGNIVLAAARNFVNNNASNTGLVASGGGKHYYVYATNPSATTPGVTGYSKHYNQTYSVGSTPAYASSGNWFFYSVAPVLSVNLASAGITYGMSDPALVSNYTGFIDSDSASDAGISGSATTAIAAYTASGAGYRPTGTYSTSVTSVAALANSLGYSFEVGSGSTLTVAAKNITVGSFSAADKLFDGSTAATITGIGGVNGVLAGDVYGFSPVGATFDTSFSGIGKTVTESSITLNGADAGNYHVTTTGLTTLATIRPSAIFVPPANTTVIAPVTPPNLTVQTQPLPPQQQPQVTPLVTGGITTIPIPHSSADNGIGRGIVVTEIHAGNNGGGILATVGDESGGFSFTVSPKLGHGLDHATMADYAALPGWLAYDPASRTFSAANVPPGGLPLVVVLNNLRNDKHVEVTISQ